MTTNPIQASAMLLRIEELEEELLTTQRVASENMALTEDCIDSLLRRLQNAEAVGEFWRESYLRVIREQEHER